MTRTEIWLVPALSMKIEKELKHKEQNDQNNG